MNDSNRIASSDNYIQLNKKITNKEILKVIDDLTEELLLTRTQVCYRFITEGAAREKNKKEKLSAMLGGIRQIG